MEELARAGRADQGHRPLRRPPPLRAPDQPRRLGAAEPGSFEPGELLDGPVAGGGPDGSGGPGAARHDPAAAPAGAARAGAGRGLQRVGGLPRGAGRQVLPPGLQARAARALASGSPRRSARSAPPSAASTATSRSRGRCCTTSASSRPTAASSPRASSSPTSAGCTARSPSATTASAARSRTSRASPSSSARAIGHIILSHHGSLEHGSPVVPCTREATLVHMVDNLGGRLGSFDRLEKELCARAAAGRPSIARSASGAFFAAREARAAICLPQSPARAA